MILTYLKRYLPSVIFGNFFALALAIVSVLLGTIVGPSVQVLSSMDDKSMIDVSTLIGDRLGWIMTMVFGREPISRQEFLLIVPGFLLAITTIKALVTLLQWFIWERVGEKISRDLRNDLVQEYLCLDPEKKLTNPQIDDQLSSLLSTDIRYIREYIVRFYGGLPREGLQSILLVGTLVLLSPELFGVFLLGVCPVLLIVNQLGKRLKKRANRALSNFSVLTEWLQQRLMGIETIKHYHTEPKELAEMQKLNESMYRKFFSAANVKALTSPLIEMMAVMAIGIVFYVSFKMISVGAINSAILISFFASLGLLSQSAGKLGKYFNKNRETSAAVARIEGALEDFERGRREVIRGHQKNELDGKPKITCEGVTFKYPGQSGFALNGFSYEFSPGMIYGIVGKSGSGKSTLFNAILGMIKPVKGKIAVTGGQIGYLPQSYALFSGSIAENISYPNPDPEFEKVNKLVGDLMLGDRVKDTAEHVADGISSFSGGQIQRLHIARLAYHDYKIVLFDEGTSALDPEIENAVFGYLKRVTNDNGIVIMIAHRPSAIRYADKVLLLEEGKLVKEFEGSKGTGLHGDFWEG